MNLGKKGIIYGKNTLCFLLKCSSVPSVFATSDILVSGHSFVTQKLSKTWPMIP